MNIVEEQHTFASSMEQVWARKCPKKSTCRISLGNIFFHILGIWGISCWVTKHSKIQWLNTGMIYYFSQCCG